MVPVRLTAMTRMRVKETISKDYEKAGARKIPVHVVVMIGKGRSKSSGRDGVISWSSWVYYYNARSVTHPRLLTFSSRQIASSRHVVPPKSFPSISYLLTPALSEHLRITLPLQSPNSSTASAFHMSIRVSNPDLCGGFSFQLSTSSTYPTVAAHMWVSPVRNANPLPSRNEQASVHRRPSASIGSDITCNKTCCCTILTLSIQISAQMI